MNDHLHSTAEDPIRVVLVICLPPAERSLLGEREEEMRSLLDTAGCEVVDVISQFPSRPVSRTYIGSGKCEDVRQAGLVNQADEVVFNVQLTPSQERNLEQATGLKVVDYSALILHIFARNARTHQAKLAVELAQLEHNRSRLKRLWSHLDRIKSGKNMRGPGEKQLEVDRRLVNDRIRDLKRKLSEIEGRKERTIQSRRNCYKICLVGYTNAGKSSLMNALTEAGVLAQDRLFATLDTRTTRLELAGAQKEVVLSDTVGFIRDLPPTLIASFHATLAEVIEADLLLHIVDASQPSMEDQIKAVEGVLETIGAQEVPQIMIFNKIDLEHSHTILLAFQHRYPGSVAASAHTGQGLDELRQSVLSALSKSMQQVTVRYPIAAGAIDAFLRRRTTVVDEHYTDEHATLVIEVDEQLLGELGEHPQLEIVPDQSAYDWL